MSKQGSDWTRDWAAKRLERDRNVQKVEIVAPQVLRVIGTEEAPFCAATIASEQVEPSDFEHLLDEFTEIKFVTNVPKESFWTGQGIRFAEARSVGWGGFGDLLKALTLRDPSAYVKNEFEFVERGLIHHTHVSSLERVHDRKYVVKRRGLPTLTVVIWNEYELTSDHVRTARERYGAFNAILITNPNGGPTSSAVGAADSMGASVYLWGQFMGRLRKR
jgi:hypothetical protein